MALNTKQATLLGWREWAALPNLDVPAIKVKIDTGARTSALHAFDIQRVKTQSGDHIHFKVQPVQRSDSVVIQASAPLVDIRAISDSGGHVENRYVVSSLLTIGSLNREIELTLTERKGMLFRMLVGRTALSDNVIVNPAASFVCGKLSTRLLYSSYDSEL